MTWTPQIAFLDLEGTLMKKDIRFDDGQVAPSLWSVLAHELGAEAYQEELTTKKKWNAGEYQSYISWMRDTVRFHQKFGLTQSHFDEAINRVEMSDGIDELFSYFRKKNVVTCIITGGFKELAERVVKKYHVDHAISACEYYFDKTLTHALYFPSDYFGKVDFMKIIMREYAASPYDAIFVGDGKNDVAMASNVAISIAFNAQDELKIAATESIDQEAGVENLRSIIDLLEHPTERMRHAIESDVEFSFVNQPTVLTHDQCIQLWKEAMWVRKSAYAPYSKFRVGAAILGNKGQIFTGCNFENAAYGSTVCAERAAVAKMISSGQQKLKGIAVTSDSSQSIPPCGDCLQVLSEFANNTDVLLCSSTGRIECQTIDSLLPRRFNTDGDPSCSSKSSPD